MNKNLIAQISDLKPKIGLDINKTLNKFQKNRTKEQKFTELSFCILVANTSLANTQRVCREINGKELSATEQELRDELKKAGYRFYNKRANYIILAREFLEELNSKSKTNDEFETRKWLVKNIKGIGCKESSHFLRNMGFTDFAILDRHIMKILKKSKVIDEIPSTISKKKYLEIEKKLRIISEQLNITLAELDLYLFYLDAGIICER
ncbi:MAG: N-glycosylase [Candidatus Aenigmatarchaeota archaeon]|nr:MAG: N-glycosylase [Candidatus Aenigmarchaeota archaeon]